MKKKLTLHSVVLLVLSFITLACHAARQSGFDFGDLENTATVCKKGGVIWAVHYGEDKQGHIVYAIFNKGHGPSPVSPSTTFSSDGSNETLLKIQINGKNVSAPDPVVNSMIIEDGKIERGKFQPLSAEEFSKFLQDKTPLSIDSLENFVEESIKDQSRTSK